MDSPGAQRGHQHPAGPHPRFSGDIAQLDRVLPRARVQHPETDKRLRVSVQLLETASGRFLRADRTEIPADKLGEFQDDVVREIVSRIEPELNRAELSTLKQRRPVDLGAWALYRQAHAILGLKGRSEETFSEAAELLRQAIARDLELTFAHAYLALLLALGHLIGLVNDEGFARRP